MWEEVKGGALVRSAAGATAFIPAQGNAFVHFLFVQKPKRLNRAGVGFLTGDPSVVCYGGGADWAV